MKNMPIKNKINHKNIPIGTLVLYGKCGHWELGIVLKKIEPDRIHNDANKYAWYRVYFPFMKIFKKGITITCQFDKLAKYYKILRYPFTNEKI